MVPVNVGNEDEIGRFCLGQIRHHRDWIDDDDLSPLFDLHAGVAERGDHDSSARSLHTGCRRHLRVPDRRRYQDQQRYAPPESHVVLLFAGSSLGGALDEPGVLDATRCLSYWTQASDRSRALPGAARRPGLRLRHLPGRLPLEPRGRAAAGRGRGYRQVPSRTSR